MLIRIRSSRQQMCVPPRREREPQRCPSWAGVQRCHWQRRLMQLATGVQRSLLR